MKKSKLISVTAVLLAFILIGVILIGIGAGTINKDKKFTETAESTKAYISTVLLQNGTRQYVLWFTYDGETYQPEYNFDDEYDYIGKEITVYFTKDAPEKVFIETEKVYYVLLYAGLALVAVSVIILGTLWISEKTKEYIIKNGKTETVKIKKTVDVIGGRKILCDSTKIRGKNAPPFESETIRGKLPKNIKDTTLTVYYLPKHKSFYYVDTKTIKMKGDAK